MLVPYLCASRLGLQAPLALSVRAGDATGQSAPSGRRWPAGLMGSVDAWWAESPAPPPTAPSPAPAARGSLATVRTFICCQESC